MGEGENVEEETSECGSEVKYCPENLDPILEAVGVLLRQQQEFEKLVDDA